MALVSDDIISAAKAKYKTSHPDVPDAAFRDDLVKAIIEAVVEAIQSSLEADLTATALQAPPAGGPVLPFVVPPRSFK